MNRSCSSWLMGCGVEPYGCQVTSAGATVSTADPKSTPPFETVITTLPGAATSEPVSAARMWLASTKRAGCGPPLNLTRVVGAKPQPKIRTSGAADPMLTDAGYR